MSHDVSVDYQIFLSKWFLPLKVRMALNDENGMPPGNKLPLSSVQHFKMKASLGCILAFRMLNDDPSAVAFTALQPRPTIPLQIPFTASSHPTQCKTVTVKSLPPSNHARQHVRSSCASSLPNNELEATPKTASSTAGNNNQRYLHELFLMMRPINFPIVTLFHILGTHLSLQLYSSSTFTSTKVTLTPLLLHPSMMMVLLSLLLVTSTSMITNDYYDARNGVDVILPSNDYNSDNDEDHSVKHHHHPLAMGLLPFNITKTFDSYLYALLLLSSAFVPGIIPRLLVISGAIVTYLYTVHLKPRTFIKNWSCAGLVALSPVTSGLAAWTVLVDTHGFGASNNVVNRVVSLGRMVCSPLSYLVVALFAGITSREILMDITDYKSDGRAGIQTIPVKYGTRVAANVAFGWSFMSGAAACALPLVNGLPILVELVGNRFGLELVRMFVSMPLESLKRLGLIVMTPEIRRLLLSVVGSTMLLHRAYSVVRTKGEDVDLAEKAVSSSLFSVLLVLASFV
jgi:4-hydroxybenzoate polyprenyltransferase